MFGKKKSEKDALLAADNTAKIEQSIKSYDSIKQFQKDAEKLAKDGWYVKLQTAHHDTNVSFWLGQQHEKLVVTYERVVKKK